MQNRSYTIQIGLLLVGALFFIPFLGSVPLFDWDEINFAESAREMIVSGNYSTVQINYQVFWEKPPLFFWMQVASMKLFGINEFAARFPNAICGIVTLLVLFNIGKKLYDKRFGLAWALVYLCSVLPFFYFKSGIIDPWFNLFIFLGIYFLVVYLEKELQTGRRREILLSAVFIGLAILTKGPVALLIFFLCVFVYTIFKRFRVKCSWLDILFFIALVAIVGGFWFILQIIQGNFDIVKDFVDYQIRLFKTKDAGHGGFLFYHFVILLIGVFPASVFALRSFKRNYYDNGFQKHFKIWMLILLWVVLILFTIVKTKIIHYSSLCYFPISFLGAYFVYKVSNHNMEYKRWTSILLIIIGSFYTLLSIFLPIALRGKDKLIQSNLIKDKFAIANLQADVTWSGFEALIGVIMLVGLIFYIIGIKRENYHFAFISIFLFTLIYINLNVLIITGKIEKYSQHATIEFYQSKSDEDCYIETLGFKSYAHLYYSRKKPGDKSISLDEDWLLQGDIDKPAYFVVKITKKDKYLGKYQDLKVLYEKNGFVFLKRETNFSTN
ncbi:MAG: glycosyltransferase family 39 protein [Bacteroidales bacterium]|nr:glycosyltransferase family 39 protein [Bacteroidales bacterium]